MQANSCRITQAGDCGKGLDMPCKLKPQNWFYGISTVVNEIKNKSKIVQNRLDTK